MLFVGFCVTKEMYCIAVSLGDDGPFQPYLEDDNEEPKEESKQSLPLSVGVEDKSGF